MNCTELSIGNMLDLSISTASEKYTSKEFLVSRITKLNGTLGPVMDGTSVVCKSGDTKRLGEHIHSRYKQITALSVN